MLNEVRSLGVSICVHCFKYTLAFKVGKILVLQVYFFKSYFVFEVTLGS